MSTSSLNPVRMKLKNRSVFFLLLSLPFLQGTQCEKDVADLNEEAEHEFREAVSIFPYRLEYNVGDTIWLEVNIPNKKLFDERTGTRVRFDSALFKSYAQAQMLYSNPFLGDGPFVQYIFPSGVSGFTNNYTYQTQAFVDFGCAPSPDYTLLLGMVLLKKGVLGINFNNMSIAQCRTKYSKNSKLLFSFDVTDTHEQYYRDLPFDSIGKRPDESVLYSLERKWMVVIRVL
jgi:hypothetical protein